MPNIQLLIKGTGGKIFEPITEDNIELETNRKGAPSRLTFTVVKDNIISFPEGAKVQLKVDGVGVFIGFVFEKSRDKAQRIQVTAYDQLRYFKNKGNYRYTNKTASEVLRMIANDYPLFSIGEIEDTGYKIGARDDVDKTLIDTVLNALDITVANTNKLYILYDDFGKIVLRNSENMKLKTLIDSDTAENFDYVSSIDEDTFNQIRLVYENDKTGKRQVYLVRDNVSIGNWGLLEYFGTIQNAQTSGKNMANGLLSLKNRKTRHLTIRNALGDPKVRAGCSLPVVLNLGDVNVQNYLLCETVTHHFSCDYHTMDLTLSGKDGMFTG